MSPCWQHLARPFGSFPWTLLRSYPKCRLTCCFSSFLSYSSTYGHCVWSGLNWSLPLCCKKVQLFRTIHSSFVENFTSVALRALFRLQPRILPQLCPLRGLWRKIMRLCCLLDYAIDLRHSSASDAFAVRVSEVGNLPKQACQAPGCFNYYRRVGCRSHLVPQ